MAEAIWQQLLDGENKLCYAQSRAALLSQSRNEKIEHSLANVCEELDPRYAKMTRLKIALIKKPHWVRLF
jgi:hypothetical protein